MAAPDRKARAQRSTALILGCISEVPLGTALMLWSRNSPDELGRQTFGRTGSFVVVVAVMVLLAGGLVILAFAARLSRTVLKVGAGASGACFGGLGVLTFGALAQDPGIWILFVLAWGLSFPVVRETVRATSLGTGKVDRDR